MAACVLPHPPALVPEVTGRRAGELAELREHCGRALDRLFAARPELVVLVGDGDRTESHRGSVAGSLRPFGIDLTFGPGDPVLPLSLTVGRWLLGERAEQVLLHFESLARDLPPADCAALGEDVAARSPRTALVVLGDGSACRDEEAAGYREPDAVEHDERVAQALARGDTAALAALEPETAARLLVAGRAGWQVLAAAAGSGPVRAELLAHEAPYGVGYFVASWEFSS